MSAQLDERPCAPVLPIRTYRRGDRVPATSYVSAMMRKADVDRLERAAEAASVSRSEAIRQGIENWIAEQEARQAGFSTSPDGQS